MTADPKATADYIAARASESLSYGDIAYAQSQGWCPSSPDGMGPHIPDDTTDPLHRLAAQLADARHRYAAARRQGDEAGAAYAQAEARRLRAILEGAGA